jgi:NDP-sugar pyrophosphorylase family protein
MFGDGDAQGVRLRYVVEPIPLGTAGAVKYAEQYLSDSVVVFNGDVMTAVDLPAVLRLHRERRAKATIVLTPVENPSAYGLVETDAAGNVRRFLEKPSPDQITCDTINAGIYVLEPGTFDRIPKDTPYSIERGYFPSLVANRETFVAYIDRGYWIDIGTPEKYRDVHRHIFEGRCPLGPAGIASGAPVVAPDARVEAGATLQGPCFLDAGVVVKAGAHIGPYSVLGRSVLVEEDARIDGAIVWPNARIGRDAEVGAALVGRSCYVGRNAVVGPQAILGDKTTLSDFTRV